MPPKLFKLSIDQESKLIELVKTKPVLFDKRLDGYRKCHDGIWDEIALELGMEGKLWNSENVIIVKGTKKSFDNL